MRNTGIPFAIAMGFLGISRHGLVASAILGAVVAGGFMGGMMALVSWRTERRLVRRGFNFTDMKPTQQREIRPSISASGAFAIATDALRSVRKLRILSQDNASGTIVAKVGVTLHSSGERVLVNVIPNEDSSIVTIRSEPRFANTPVDGGKGIENVETFVRAFNGLLIEQKEQLACVGADREG